MPKAEKQSSRACQCQFDQPSGPCLPDRQAGHRGISQSSLRRAPQAPAWGVILPNVLQAGSAFAPSALHGIGRQCLRFSRFLRMKISLFFLSSPAASPKLPPGGVILLLLNLRPAGSASPPLPSTESARTVYGFRSFCRRKIHSFLVESDTEPQRHRAPRLPPGGVILLNVRPAGSASPPLPSTESARTVYGFRGFCGRKFHSFLIESGTEPPGSRLGELSPGAFEARFPSLRLRCAGIAPPSRMKFRASLPHPLPGGVWWILAE
jgi:hypothetical protein